MASDLVEMVVVAQCISIREHRFHSTTTLKRKGGLWTDGFGLNGFGVGLMDLAAVSDSLSRPYRESETTTARIRKLVDPKSAIIRRKITQKNDVSDETITSCK
ncbi:hypothetical protein CEXT_756311 [Caerostris extrusa]|uniref:Uncharacterized protein n=1 Tax=Caerostris extrusa TaxID=172846 RepID=A0AAV4SQ48_CAEEX|nr:hypothetical protein CEXT_756311 [Caerostris extrusa]